jgi:hypothetical protein
MSTHDDEHEPELPDTRLLVLSSALLLAGAVALVSLAVPPQARTVTIVLGAVVSVILVAHLFTPSATDVAPMVAITGVALTAVSLATNELLVAGAAVLLLAFTEVASLRTTLIRVVRSAAVDVEGRLRDVSSMLLVAAIAAATAAIGSLLRMSGQIIGVMLAGLAVFVIGKMIATSARS